ncbi:Transcription initiation factor TFIID subunit 3 [Halotydeus destructor]|nr:Transcription initiation factor TFIID subunit 3 [Halotydeus destructor]
MVVSAYAESLLKVAIGQICANIGWNSVGDQSLDILSEISEHYVRSLGRVSQQYANHSDRTQASLPDVLQAFHRCNVSLCELGDYVTVVESVPLPVRVPRFPVNLSTRGPSRLKFAGQSARETQSSADSSRAPADNLPLTPPPTQQSLNIAELDEERRHHQRLAELISMQQDEEEMERERILLAPVVVEAKVTNDSEEDEEEEEENEWSPETYYEPWLPPRLEDRRESLNSDTGKLDANADNIDESMALAGAKLKVSELESIALSSVTYSSSGQIIGLGGKDGIGPVAEPPSDSEADEIEPPKPSRQVERDDIVSSGPTSLKIVTSRDKSKDAKKLKLTQRKGKENDKKEKKKDKKVKGPLGLLSIKVSGLKSGTPTASPKVTSAPDVSNHSFSSLSKAEEDALDASIDAVIARASSTDIPVGDKELKSVDKEVKSVEKKKRKEKKEKPQKPIKEETPPFKLKTSFDDTINDVISSAMAAKSPGLNASPAPSPPVTVLTPAARKLVPPVPSPIRNVSSPIRKVIKTEERDEQVAAQILVSMSEGAEGLGREEPIFKQRPADGFGFAKVMSPPGAGLPSNVPTFPTPPLFGVSKPQSPAPITRPSMGSSFSPFSSHASPAHVFSPGSNQSQSSSQKPFKTLAEKKALPPLPVDVENIVIKEEKKSKKRKKEKKDKDKDEKAAKKRRKEEKLASASGDNIPRLSIKFSKEKDSKDEKKEEKKEKKKDKERDREREKDKEREREREKKPIEIDKSLTQASKKSCILITETIKQTVEHQSKKEQHSPALPVVKKEKKEKIPKHKSSKKVPGEGKEPVEGGKIWICPTCKKPDDGSPMLGCDECDDWYHWTCLGITCEPKEDSWFCVRYQQQQHKEQHSSKPKSKQISSSEEDSEKSNESESDYSGSEQKHRPSTSSSKSKKSSQIAKKERQVEPKKPQGKGGIKAETWVCPRCNKIDDGTPMIGCDVCDDWYHWACMGILYQPKEEDPWLCPRCDSKKRKEAKLALAATPAASQEGSSSAASGGRSWSCGTCKLSTPGQPMVGCDGCDRWYHWTCVDMDEEPEENESWFCKYCIAKQASIATKVALNMK